MPQAAENLLTSLVVVVAGPTASGKSALAVDIARAFDGEVINADSCQIYQGAPILSACPDAESKKAVPHHLYEIYPPEKNGNVVDWLDLAIAQIQDCRLRRKLPVVVGGTGLYINNLIYGTTPIPAVSDGVREAVARRLAEEGPAAMHEALRAFDEKSAERIPPQDICRIRRAFEVYLETKKPLSEWHKLPMVQKLDRARFFVVKIMPPKEELDLRCDERFDKMVEAGAFMEARQMLAKNLDSGCPAMQIIGIKELAAAEKGKLSLEDAVTAAKLRSRQYAKRQKTWFSRQLQADFELTCCYGGQSQILDVLINCVKKTL